MIAMLFLLNFSLSSMYVMGIVYVLVLLTASSDFCLNKVQKKGKESIA